VLSAIIVYSLAFLCTIIFPPNQSNDNYYSPHQLVLTNFMTKNNLQLIMANETKESIKYIHHDSNYFIHKHDFQLDAIVDSSLTNLEGLPRWVKEYFEWHNQQVKKINKDNWSSFQYLIMQCIRGDAHCGGASDRLKPIPLLLLTAYKYKRIFLIWWTRPCPLEEFLMPNAINWTIPWYIPVADGTQNGKLVGKTDRVQMYASKTSISIIRTRLQSYDGGSIVYERLTNSSYDDIYHDIFRLLFIPAPPIANILRQELKESGLTPGEYAVAHYRAFYARASRLPHTISVYAINAVNCASQLRPGGPIYFASDSLHALETVRNYSQQNDFRIITIENQEPLHLDKGENWSQRYPSDFYSIFVDLYLMGMGRCLSFGQGGFGRYGLLLSYNASCFNRHTWNLKMIPCTWKFEGATQVS
jgi:hypothetical protein